MKWTHLVVFICLRVNLEEVMNLNGNGEPWNGLEECGNIRGDQRIKGGVQVM